MAVTLKPMQRDLFTGELVKKPKRGRGGHIKLTGAYDQRIVAGMAHFAGTGPQGKYCKDCVFLEDMDYRRRGAKDPTTIHDVCMKARRLVDRPDPIPRGGLAHERACKYFQDAGTKGSVAEWKQP